MHERPVGVDDPALSRALRAWEIEPVSLEYAPVGFGDHHWTAVDTEGRRWFVTVSDLDHKSHCGTGAKAAGQGLRRAMDTALALRRERALDFVVAPTRTVEGETVLNLGERYAVTVFPLVEGVGGNYGDALPDAERGALLDLLAALHRTPAPSATPVLETDVPGRPVVERALAELAGPWGGGPFAEPTRELLGDHQRGLRERWEEFDRRAAELRASGREPVVTHGEPHPGNLLWVAGETLLIDWDTVGLAVPERDLWSVAVEPADLERYVAAGGRQPDPSAMALYRLRWDLDDLSVYLEWFRSPHERTSDGEAAWAGLTEIVARLTA